MESSIALDYEITPDGAAWIVRALVKITGDAPETAARTPLNLSVVLDRSGSMSGTKLEQAKDAAVQLVRRLAPEDVVSVVAYDDEVHTVSMPASGAGQAGLTGRIRTITPGGTTNLSGGWLRGRELVAERKVDGGVNRVLLLTDGLANVGITDPELLVGLCRTAAAGGITTSTIGFGEGFDEDLLGRMAEGGGGATYYIEHPDQAPAVFAEEIEGLLSLSAQNLAVEIRPAATTEGVVVHHRYPASQIEGGMRYELGDLYAREPRLLLAEFIVLAASLTEEEVEVAELVLSAHVLTPVGTVENRQVRLPIHLSHQAGATVHPEVRKELLLQRAARAREEAKDAQRRGDYDHARVRLQEACDAMAAAPHQDEEMREEVQDLKEMAARFEEGAVTEADAKYLNQRSLAHALNRKRSAEVISRTRRK